MPRYTQVTPTFAPVDYATRIAPLEQYKDEYDKRLDKIEEQGLLADAIGGLIDENTDPELMQVYNDYSTKMQNTAKDLLDSGDLRSSRQSLLELRRDYANKLLPIRQAFNNRAEAAKSFREQKAKDPTYIGTDPLSHGLKDYINGKSPNDKSVSGAQLYAMGQSDAKAASSRRILRDKWGLDSSLGNQYFSRMIREGWSQKEIEDALYKLSNGTATEADLKDASGAVRYLQEAGNRIANAYKIADFNDDEKIAQSQAFIMNGLLSGMTYSEDDDTKSYDPAFWDKAEKTKLDLEKARREAVEDGGNDLPYTLVPLTEVADLKGVSQAKDDLSFLGRMKADPSKVMQEMKFAGPQAPGIGKQNSEPVTSYPNFDKIARLAKKYNVDLEGYVTNQNGKYIINNSSKLEDLIDRVASIAHQEASINIPVYNTTKDDNLINQINKRSITSKDVKKENKHGIAEYTGEELPSGGTFRLNPYMKGSDVYYEYVVRNSKGDYDVYHIGPDSVDSTVAGTLNGKSITYTEYWLKQYRDAMSEASSVKNNPEKYREVINRANTARHNAMVLAYGSAEQKAKVRSTTDSKL